MFKLSSLLIGIGGTITLVGAGLSSWFFIDGPSDNIEASFNVNVDLKGLGNFGDFLIDAPNFIIFEEGNNPSSLSDGLNFYQKMYDENIIDMDGYFGLSLLNQFSIQFLPSEEFATYQYNLKIRFIINGFEIDGSPIITTTSLYNSLVDENDPNEAISFTSFGDEYDPNTMTLTINLLDYFQYASMEVKPHDIDSYKALVASLNTSNNFVTIEAYVEVI